MTVIERFKEIVPIDNPSGGEENIRSYIQEQLNRSGRFEQVVDEAGNLFVRIPGDNTLDTILLSAHMDSVPPCHGILPLEDVLDGRPVIRSEGKTILGADDKSGIAVILELVARLSEQGFQRNHPLELLFSTREEVGLLGAKAFDVNKIKAKYAYVLDGEGHVGDIFNAGPSQENLQIVCHGKASHTGIAPEEGISAIQMAAALCTRLPSGRLSETLTTNLGVIQGGTAMNIVAPSLILKGEARGHREADLQSLLGTCRKTCQAIEQQYPGSRIEFIATRRYDHYEVPAEHIAVNRAVSACGALGLPVRVKPMNIGSDAHVLNHNGLPTLVLGMGFHFSHSLGEFISVEELEQVAQWVEYIVKGGV